MCQLVDVYRTGLYPDDFDQDDDPLEGEASGLQELVTVIEISCTAEEFLVAEDGEKRQEKKF